MNLFQMLTDQSAGLQVHAKGLNSLSRKVHRPLDKPRKNVDPELAQFDALVDSGVIPVRTPPALALARPEVAVASVPVKKATRRPRLQ